MAIYHFSVKAISRGAGRSAVACAAYRSGEKLVCDYYGMEQDYTKKSGVEFTNIYAPENTKKELLDRQKLWNAVEKSERRKDALLAREFEIAFPQELNQEQRQNLLNELCQGIVKKHGVIVDAAIHAPHTGSGSDERNYHAHIMFTTRAINKNGTFEAKKYRDFSRDNGTGVVTQWRKDFADLVNTQLEQIGSTERVSHLSYADLGIDLEATQHEGYEVTHQRRRYEAEQQKNEEYRDLAIIMPDIAMSNDAIKQRNADRCRDKQEIKGLDQEIIASESIVSDLQQSKAKSDAEHAQQQQIALERKRERLEAQSLADAHNRATDFHTAFNPNRPDKALATQYITDYALLARHGKQPQPPAPVEQPQPTWWQRMTGQQLPPVEQPPFFEIDAIKAIAQSIVEHEKEQAQQQKWQRLQEFLQHSPATVDRLERDAISRSFEKADKGKVFVNDTGDAELAEFIKYHRQHRQEKEQAAKDRQAEHDRFMREEAAKAREEAALIRQRERELEANREAYRERKALVDKEIAEMQQKPVNRDEIQQQPRPKNDFEP